MAVDKLVDSSLLNNGLTQIANSIRKKTGKSSYMAFPNEFVQEINSITSGGGGEGNSFEKTVLILPNKQPNFRSGNTGAISIWGWAKTDTGTAWQDSYFLFIGNKYSEAIGADSVELRNLKLDDQGFLYANGPADSKNIFDDIKLGEILVIKE